jgi:DNA-binding NarL/FixJ family response regulator
MLLDMSAQPVSLHPAPVTVFVAARHDRVRAALRSLMETEPGIEPVAAMADVADLIRLLRRVRPAVVVVDESVLGTAGVGWLPTLLTVASETAFVIVGMHDHPGFVTRAREAGAVDYICLDDADRLIRSVAEAGTRSPPSTAGRRRAGRRAVSVVPAPGAESISRLPPSSSTRSRIPSSPNPSARSDGSNP